MRKLFKNLFTLLFIFIPTVSLLPDCKVDQDKFCKDIPSPKAKITQCLLEHTNDLSESCKANLKDYVEKMRTQASGACKEDVNQFCKWVIPGGGRILKCLFKNESSLSASCKKILNE